MKRVLSILMVICLIVSFCSTALATDAVTETGVKITYPIGKYVTSKGTFSALTYESTGGYWAYAANYNNADSAFGGNFKDWYAGTGIQIASNGAQRWFAIKAIVPVSGKYKAVVNRGKYTGSGAGSVYVIPVSTDIASGLVNSNCFGNFSCTGGTAGSFSVWETVTLGNVRTINAGEYYIVYKLDSGNNIAVGDITLSTVNTENAEYSEYSSAYMGIASVSETELEVGDSATASVVMTDSITHEAIADITYTSSNEAVATVASDGTVTAVAPGTTTISAKADGYAYGNVIAKEITVTRPADAAVGTKIVYDIGSYMGTAMDDTNTLFSDMTYEKTGGFWEYHSNSANVTTVDNTNFKYHSSRGLQFGNKAWFAMKVNIPVSGKYRAELYHGKIKSSGGQTRVYIIPKSADINSILNSTSTSNAFGDVACSGGTASYYTWASGGVDFISRLQNARNLTAGEYYLVYKHYTGTHSAAGDIVLYSVDEDGNDYSYYDPAYVGITSADETELTVGEATEVSAIISDSVSHENISEFTYVSSDPKVAKVNASTGTVTALAPGKATISAVCSDYEKGNVLGTEITVTAPMAKTNVSFVVSASADDATITVESDDFVYNNAVDSVARGTEVTLTANPLDGYTFVGWKRGSNATHGSYISTENPFTTKLYTNTYLTAVYIADSADEEAVVEYYNQNGDYIDTLSCEEESPVPETIPGFTFEAGNWFTDEDVKLVLSEVTKRTCAVALHTAKENAGTVIVDGNTSDATAFDSPITSTATGAFTCWKRDGRIVSYDRSYTYYLWDSTTITQSDEAVPAGKKLPLIILDDDKVDGAYMIEYDAADYEIAEVGLVFSDSGIPSIDSCSKKFTSQRKLTHGQMSAKYSDNVRGYLIYKDGDNFRVIYSD